MRLLCPNCDAEYEVDAAAIPDTGRDVQCSNCGHAWFQQHPDFEANIEAESALYDAPPPLADRADAPEWHINPDDPEALLEAMETEGAGAAPPRREIDPAVLQILREEAEREQSLRQGDEVSAQEPEPLPEPVQEPVAAAVQEPEIVANSPVVARRVARLKGIQPSTPAPEPEAAPIPRAQLPDIEEVSAALGRGDDNAVPQATGRGFGAGMMGVVGLGAAAVLPYVFSPQIVENLPALADPLANYVSFINSLRDKVDARLPVLIDGVKGALPAVLEWIKAQGWI